jgi:hypothetical protein
MRTLPEQQNGDIIDIHEVRKILGGISQPRVMFFVYEEKLPAYVYEGGELVKKTSREHGKKTFFKRSEVEAFASQQRTPGRPEVVDPGDMYKVYQNHYYKTVSKPKRLQLRQQAG